MLQWPWRVIRMDKNTVDQARTQGCWKGGCAALPSHRYLKKKKVFCGYDVKGFT